MVDVLRVGRAVKGRRLEATPVVGNFQADGVAVPPQPHPVLGDAGMAIGVGECLLQDAVDGNFHGERHIVGHAVGLQVHG